MISRVAEKYWQPALHVSVPVTYSISGGSISLRCTSVAVNAPLFLIKIW